MELSRVTVAAEEEDLDAWKDIPPQWAMDASRPLRIFISYFQETGARAVLPLREGLLSLAAAAGVHLELWLDVDRDPTAAGMHAGVAEADVFLLCVSARVLTRPAVQHEVKAALLAHKRIVALGIDCTGREALAQARVLLTACTSPVVTAANDAGAAALLLPPLSPQLLLRLEARDLDELAPHLALAATFSDVPVTFASSTLPRIAAALGLPRPPPRFDPAAPAANAPLRMRRPPLQSALARDILIIHGSQDTAPLALFLRLALGRACARRPLVISGTEALSHGGVPSAEAAVAAAGAVILILARSWYENDVVAAAATAAIARMRQEQQKERRRPPFALLAVWEADARFGGLYPFSALLEATVSARPELAPLFGLVTARRFQREQPHRSTDVLHLALAAGALRSDALGGRCPPPPLPPGYQAAPTAPLLAALSRALLGGGGGGGGSVAVALGGLGGAGKTTLASSLAHAPATRSDFDDVLWLSVGESSAAALLQLIATAVEEMQEGAEGGGGAGGGGRNAPPPRSFDTFEEASRALQKCLHGGRRRILLIVDDCRARWHFAPFLTAFLSCESVGGGGGPRLLFTTRDLSTFRAAAATAASTSAWPAGAPTHAGCALVDASELAVAPAAALLAAAAGIPPAIAAALDLSPTLSAIGKRLPLSLGLVGAALGRSLGPLAAVPAEGGDAAAAMTAFGSLPARLASGALASAADASRCAALRAQNVDAEAYMPLYAAIDFALRAHLAPDDALSLLSLGIFRKGAAAPLRAVALAWRMGKGDTRALLRRLQAAGLVKWDTTAAASATASTEEEEDAPAAIVRGGAANSEEPGAWSRAGDADGGTVSLHDLTHDYAAAAVAPGWHAAFLGRLLTDEGCGGVEDVTISGSPTSLRAWWTLPLRSTLGSYASVNLFYHLYAAGASDEAAALLMRFEWLARVCESLGFSALCDSILTYGVHARESAHQDATPFRLLHQALVLAGPGRFTERHLSAGAVSRYERVDGPTALAQELLGRLRGAALAHPASLGALLRGCRARDSRGRPWLAFLTPSLPAPGSSLECVVEGGESEDNCLREVSEIIALPNGRFATSAGRTIRVFDASGACDFTLRGHSKDVEALAVLPGGRLASGGRDKSLCIWDTNLGICDRSQSGPEEITQLAALSDGRLAAAAWNECTVRVWDLSREPPVTNNLAGHAEGVSCLAPLPDAALVSASYDLSLRVWNAAGQCAQVLRGHTEYVRRVVVLPEGRLASSCGKLSSAQLVWGASDVRDRRILVWDTASGAQLHALEGYETGCMLGLRDGRLAVGSRDRGTARVWDATRGLCERLISAENPDRPHEGFYDKPLPVLGLEELLDGRLLVAAKNAVLVWDLSTDESSYVEALSNSSTQLCRLSDGRVVVNAIAVADQPESTHLRILRLTPTPHDVSDKTGSAAAALAAAERSQHTDGINALLVLPNGCVVSGSDDTTLRVWDTSGACTHVLRGHRLQVTTLRLQTDGRVRSEPFRYGGTRDTMRAWDLATGASEEDPRPSQGVGDASELNRIPADFTRPSKTGFSVSLTPAGGGAAISLHCDVGSKVSAHAAYVASGRSMVCVGTSAGRMHFFELLVGGEQI